MQADASNVYLYVNGQLSLTRAFPTPATSLYPNSFYTKLNYFFMNRDYQNPQTGADASYYLFRFYARVLTAGEITGGATTCQALNPTASPTQVG